MSISAFVLGLAQFIFVVNFFYSLFWGQKAGRNPWHSNTLEWTAPSPPPHGNFETTPIVYRGPYEYGDPDVAGRRLCRAGAELPENCRRELAPVHAEH